MDYAEYDAVVRHCSRWMSRLARAHATAAGRLTESAAVGEPHRIELRRVFEDVDECIAVNITCDAGALHVRVHRCLGLPLAEGPQRPSETSRCLLRPPSLVRSLIHEFGAFRDREVLLCARVMDSADALSLGDYLLSPKRSMPVVVASRTDRGALLVGPSQLALTLAGLAHVYVLASERCAIHLRQMVGDALHCEGGSVRLYRPGLQLSDLAARHPIWRGGDEIHHRHHLANEALWAVLDG